MPELQNIREEYGEISEKLADPELISRWDEFQKLSKRRAHLEKIVKRAEELDELKERIEENSQIVSAAEDELASLAQAELTELLRKKEQLENELREFLREEAEPRLVHRAGPDAIIMEIRPGAGGEEASLFAADLFRMYTKYAQRKGFAYTVLDVSETDVGGVREASIEFRGKEAARALGVEGGVHRVQRIPSTEKSGRVHTSTASVAILPKANKTEIQLNPAELKIDTFNASGPGGQNVNKRQTAVRATHVPTGLVATAQASRNQQQNRDFALTLLAAKLLQERRAAEGAAIAGQRKEQIRGAERSEKIRTYNFPQDRVTDHRIKKSFHGIEKIMEGNLDAIVEASQDR